MTILPCHIRDGNRFQARAAAAIGLCWTLPAALARASAFSSRPPAGCLRTPSVQQLDAGASWVLDTI